MRQCFLRNEEKKSLLCEREFNVRINAPKMRTSIPLKRTRRRHCLYVLVFIVCAAAFFVSTPVSADVSVTDPGEDLMILGKIPFNNKNNRREDDEEGE